MNTLIGNQVKTEFSNYAFGSREEAEAFYFAAKDRAAHRSQAKVEKPVVSPQAGTHRPGRSAHR